MELPGAPGTASTRLQAHLGPAFKDSPQSLHASPHSHRHPPPSPHLQHGHSARCPAKMDCQQGPISCCVSVANQPPPHPPSSTTPLCPFALVSARMRRGSGHAERRQPLSGQRGWTAPPPHGRRGVRKERSVGSLYVDGLHRGGKYRLYTVLGAIFHSISFGFV